MRICFLVNRAERQTCTYTTLIIALEAARRGHEVRYVDIDGFSLHEGPRVEAWTVRAPEAGADEDAASYAPRFVRHAVGPRECVDLTAFDVVFLRNNPADQESYPIGMLGNPALDFGRFLKYAGVLVLNDPDGIARAATKMYLQQFPVEIRARTLVARQPADIRAFLKELDGPAVIKPMSGFGGEDVFYLERGHVANRNQIIAAATRKGYALVQEFLPEATRGDRRLILLDGEPLMVDGRAAIYERIRAQDDFRANLHVGGTGCKAEFTPADARTSAALKDQLKADGLYLVGVDLVGSRVLELNVMAPGGLYNANRFQGINSGKAIVEDLERRVRERSR